MFNLNEFLTFEYQNAHVLEHDLEHDLQMKKNFSTPKIYNAKGNLNKRWYIYFSYRNPETGKLQRMKNIYGKSNVFKTKEERLSVLIIYRKKLVQLLKAGFNPFEENTKLLKKTKTSETSINNTIITQNSVQPVVATVVATVVESVEINEIPRDSSNNTVLTPNPTVATDDTNSTTIKEAIDFALTLKEKTVSYSTYKAYLGKTNTFQLFITENFPEVKNINQLSKKMVMQFLNDILLRTSARTRNNTRVELSSIFQTLEDNEIITTNFIKNISVLRSIPKRNKTYTNEKQEEIFNYLEEKDPVLLLFIKFISYNLLRPIEVCRLNVEDLNLHNKTLQFKAKNSPLKTKIIPELLINDLPDLSQLDKNLVLFTPDKIGGE